MRLSGEKVNGIVLYAAPAFCSVLLRLDAFDNVVPESTLTLGGECLIDGMKSAVKNALKLLHRGSGGRAMGGYKGR